MHLFLNEMKLGIASASLSAHRLADDRPKIGRICFDIYRSDIFICIPADRIGRFLCDSFVLRTELRARLTLRSVDNILHPSLDDVGHPIADRTGRELLGSNDHNEDG